jgi:hypothetical protein
MARYHRKAVIWLARGHCRPFVRPSSEVIDPLSTAELIFGDWNLSQQLRDSAQWQARCSPSRAKFVRITIGEERIAHAGKVAGEIDEHLPFECREHELFAAVQRLIGVDGSPYWHPAPSTAIRPQSRDGLSPGALRRARAHIEEHFFEKVRTHMLARIAELSLRHFNRAFMQSTGFSPHQFILRQCVAFATDPSENDQAPDRPNRPRRGFRGSEPFQPDLRRGYR